MTTVLCPTCGDMKRPITKIDGSHTETCKNCHSPFSYRVKEGKTKPWEPPKRVSVRYAGAGKAGGK